jgi:two-component system, cell cycle sensor histidine kinase and response regulator CckA
VPKMRKSLQEADALRQKAEEKIKAGAIAAGSNKLTAKDAPKLLHDLQVHQVELEMQNEELRRAQVELEESRKKYVDLFDFAPVGYLVLDEQGIILEINLTLAQRLGIERGRLLHKPFLLHVAPEDRDVFYLHLRTTMQSDSEQTCEIGLVPGDGSKYHVQLSSIAVRNAKSHCSCHSSLADISARKQMEAALRNSQQLLEMTFLSLRDGVFVIGLPARIILACNPSAERIFGCTKREMVGHTTEFFHQDRTRYEEFSETLLSALAANGVYRVEYQLRRKDGNGITAELSATEMLDESGRRCGYVLVVRDITEQKRMEEELQRIRKTEATGIDSGVHCA